MGWGGYFKYCVNQATDGRANDAHADPAFRNPIAKTGATLVSSSPEECRTFMVSQIERCREDVKTAKIDPQ